MLPTGIESRLDYIKDLGVGAVLLSPIYKSPMKDFGYDIQDFGDIAPVFGTMDDFHSLAKAMHKRGKLETVKHKVTCLKQKQECFVSLQILMIYSLMLYEDVYKYVNSLLCWLFLLHCIR